MDIVSKPSLAMIRRHLAHTMTAHGYHLGKKALHRDCDDGVRVSLTFDSVPCGFGNPPVGQTHAERLPRPRPRGLPRPLRRRPEFDIPGLAFTLGNSSGNCFPVPTTTCGWWRTRRT